jgi:hypothetical protein
MQTKSQMKKFFGMIVDRMYFRTLDACFLKLIMMKKAEVNSQNELELKAQASEVRRESAVTSLVYSQSHNLRAYLQTLRFNGKLVELAKRSLFKSLCHSNAFKLYIANSKLQAANLTSSHRASHQEAQIEKIAKAFSKSLHFSLMLAYHKLTAHKNDSQKASAQQHYSDQSQQTKIYNQLHSIFRNSTLNLKHSLLIALLKLATHKSTQKRLTEFQKHDQINKNNYEKMKSKFLLNEEIFQEGKSGFTDSQKKNC